MKIVLVEPCIPQNTGNIIRTCKATGNDLILVEPLGFRLSDRMLKRAGLDYYKEMSIDVIQDLDEYLNAYPHSFYFFSSKATKGFHEVSYDTNSLLIFGSETSGLPPIFWEKYPEKFVKIPMIEDVRCLNLANSVAISIYEAWRQRNFAGSTCFDR